MKTKQKKDYYILRMLLFFTLSLPSFALSSQTIIKGIIQDAQTKEALIGATITIKGQTKGTTTNFDGFYELELSPGKYQFLISYLSYKSIVTNEITIQKGETKELNLLMEEDNHFLDEINVVAKKNREAENILITERKNSTLAIENLGAREMSVKGLSTVADGIKKITGISMEGKSQVIVRGLGDRYNMTSLNGFPIASPNPDNKLIPLTLFPTAIVQNITVSKVFQPTFFGDYSGAHINIETKENIGKDFLTIGISTGGKSNTLYSTFYSSHKKGAKSPYWGFSKGLKMNKKIEQLTSTEFENYIKQDNPFKTSFQIEKSKSHPELGLEFSAGKSFKFHNQTLDILGALNFNNDYTILENAYTSTINAQGITRDAFLYNQYNYETTLTTLGQINYGFREKDRIAYNLMFVNNTEDSYSHRIGHDAEGNELEGSNSIYHIYTLQNHQLNGKHYFLNKLQTDWQVSYGKTTSDEPDRRQVMFAKNQNGSLSLFKLNQQETMRYFGELTEDEWNGELKLKYHWNQSRPTDFIRIGGSLRSKSRNFSSVNFYYNLKGIDPVITSVYNTNEYLNFDNLQNGSLEINKNAQPRNTYFAGSDIYASFLDFEYEPVENLLIAGGVRYEQAKQWVRYWTDAAAAAKQTLRASDLFPALNLKYNISPNHSLRFSFSRTITRPAFLEMAPFEYQESYGGITSRGYADIQNGYNNNLDLRYEFYNKQANMYSLGIYYKHIETPIEKIQEYAGSLIQSFRNANKGTAAGLEFEMRQHLTPTLKLDFNASYIYTHISLPKESTYTDKSRRLQGASPYLLNLDFSYNPYFSKEHQGSFSLIYNLQGPRIYSVGIGGVKNVIEEAYHSLDWIGSLSFNQRINIKVYAKNLLNRKERYTQKIENEHTKDVQYYKKGLSFGLGISFNL